MVTYMLRDFFRRQTILLLLVAIVLSLCSGVQPVAASSSSVSNSSNFGVREVQFGNGGELHACSTTYCSKQSSGELAVGNTTTTTLYSTADTYIHPGAANTNYGTANPISASSAAYHSILRFDTSKYTSVADISSVTLRLYANTTDTGGFQIHPHSDVWNENTVTWNNAPAWNATILATSGSITSNQYIDITLPATAITTGGTTDFGVDFSRAGIQTFFSSREDGQHPPTLLINHPSTTSYQAQAGFNTDRDPFLEVNVTGTGVDLGYVTSSSAAFGTSTFTVKSYLATGYVVAIEGLPLKNSGTSGYTIPYMSTAGVSTPGTEQFGINLRQNTSPSVGADPVQVPSGGFSYGTPAAGYSTVDTFKYANGDIIANALSSSGETDYTLAMILNVATTSPGGQYKGRIGIDAIPTF